MLIKDMENNSNQEILKARLTILNLYSFILKNKNEHSLKGKITCLGWNF